MAVVRQPVLSARFHLLCCDPTTQLQQIIRSMRCSWEALEQPNKQACSTLPLCWHWTCQPPFLARTHIAMKAGTRCCESIATPFTFRQLHVALFLSMHACLLAATLSAAAACNIRHLVHNLRGWKQLLVLFLQKITGTWPL